MLASGHEHAIHSGLAARARRWDGVRYGDNVMKLAGLLLMLAGWLIVVSALVLLAPTHGRTGFVLAGIAVEVLGLTLVFRGHFPAREKA